MDINSVAAALQGTLDPEKRAQSEETLSQMFKIISFTPTLLQICNNQQYDLPLKQAAVVYLKNIVKNYWVESTTTTPKKTPNEMAFVIHEQDKHLLRQLIVPCVAKSPSVISTQLANCTGVMLENDFPVTWPNVIDEITCQLSTTDAECWHGALLVLYRLVKNYEYKKCDEKKPLVDTMRVILPMLFERLRQLMSNQSQESVLLQKMILKIFFALVQFSLNLELMSREHFADWLEAVREIVARPIPKEADEIDIEERPELVWWKCKKWAMHLLHRIFERYGNPATAAREYNEFASYYLKKFSDPVIQTIILSSIDTYRQGVYVSPRFLHESLMYLSEGCGHSFSWKFIKQHIMVVIEQVIFPLMCHTEQDQELWDEDPEEFIRTRYDVFEELLNPVHAGSTLLSNAVKRKDILARVVQFAVQILNNAEATAQQRDGALHMIGALSVSLLNKKIYKTELENMLVNHVYPMLQRQEGFLRARACWCIREFSKTTFKNVDNLTRALELCVNGLLHDTQLPVQVEAAMAIHLLVQDQEKASKLMERHVRPVIMQLLELIAKTKNDDICTVMQCFIDDYIEQVIPIAVEAAQRLATIFDQLMANDESVVEDRHLTAMAILSTLESILTVMEDHKDIMIHLEQIVLTIIGIVIGRNIDDFYEEVISLVCSLTTSQITEPMWQVYSALFQLFENEGSEYFIDIMSALHNYLTVDTDQFLAEPERLTQMLTMCQKVFVDEPMEDIQCHAAKLYECIVLQCAGKIDTHLTTIMQSVLERLTRQIISSELRQMCLQVLIAVFQYNPQFFFETLLSMQPSDHNSNSLTLIDNFISKWLDDTDVFLGVHDRKMCLLGLTTLIGLQSRPNILQKPDVASQLIPSCILLFDGLEKAYETKAQKSLLDDSDDDGDSDDDEIEDDPLEDDEDDVDEDSEDYAELLAKLEKDSGNDDEYSETDFLDETDLEIFDTPLDQEDCQIDEYCIFKTTLQAIQQNNDPWYQMLIGGLNEDQVTKIQKVFTLADQRQAAAESKKIEGAGGYKFQVQSVPQNFNFGF